MTAADTRTKDDDKATLRRERLWTAATLATCIVGAELLFLIAAAAWGGVTSIGSAFVNAAILVAVLIPAVLLLTVPPYQNRVRELEAQGLELRTGRDRLGIIVDNLPIIPYLANLEEPYRLRFTGPRIADLTGFTEGFLSECPGIWLDRVHPNHRRRVAEAWTELKASGSLEHEYLWFVSNGEYRWFHDSLRLVRGEDGRPVGVAGTIRDITELRTAWESLGQARDSIRETLRTVLDDPEAHDDLTGTRWGPFAKRELEGVADDLAKADLEVVLLRSLLPICAHCTGSRLEPQLEGRAAEYMQARPVSHFAAALCPDCLPVSAQPRRRA